MTKEQEAILKRAIDHYGIDNQLTKTVEELSELTKEICKLKIAGGRCVYYADAARPAFRGIPGDY